jgi:hypothetical protein
MFSTFSTFNSNINIYKKPHGNIYNYTGTNQFVAVPSNKTNMSVMCWGAGGASSGYGTLTGPLPTCFSGGGGGFTQAIFYVSPNTTYTIVVGRGGDFSPTDGTNCTPSFGGGGGCAVLSGTTQWRNCSGGGRSSIMINGNDIITAGGGGGGGKVWTTTTIIPLVGGPGGGIIGGDASNNGTLLVGGGGGTSTTGGIVQTPNAVGTAPTTGSKYQGGDGCQYCAGGGGGYYGGGGGAIKSPSWSIGGGGGGSSYVNNALILSGTTTTILQASGLSVANNTQLPIPGTIGNGGAGISPTTSTPGNYGQNGLVIIDFY